MSPFLSCSKCLVQGCPLVQGGFSYLDLKGVFPDELAVRLQGVADREAAAALPDAGLGPVGVHAQHEAAEGRLIEGEMLLPFLEDHLGVDGPLPQEGDPVGGDAKGGEGPLQSPAQWYLPAHPYFGSI